LLAGINAARLVANEPGWCPRRNEAYLGVLVDDLITRGVSEPYRMFTSRAEYRLTLREDNADLRLTQIGRRLGLIEDTRWDVFNRRRDAIALEQIRLKETYLGPTSVSEEDALRVFGQKLEREYSLAELLRRPIVSYCSLLSISACGQPLEDEGAALQVEIQAKYQGYIERQRDEVIRAQSLESLAIPATLDYVQVRGLSVEARQKLDRHRPETVGQASRLSGITPATISLLLVHLKRISSAAGHRDAA